MVYKVILSVARLYRAIVRVSAIVKPLRTMMESHFGSPMAFDQLFEGNRRSIESPKWQEALLKQSNKKPMKEYEKRVYKSDRMNMPWWKKLSKSAASSTSKSTTKYKRIDNKIAPNVVISSSISAYTFPEFFDHMNQGLNPAQQTTIQTTSVLQIVHQRKKRNVELLEKLKDKEVNPNKHRSKRQLHEQISTNSSNHFDVAQQASTLDGFYRHPKLSYEEQKTLLEKFKGSFNNGTLKTTNMNTNSSPTLYKRMWDTINVSQRELESIESPKESRKFNKITEIQKCNETAADIRLNNTQCSLAQSINLKEEDSKDMLRSHKLLRESKNIVDKEKKTKGKQTNITEPQTFPPNKSYLAPSALAKQQKKAKVYINLQDHQKNNEHTESGDIPEYNPDNIPYVEVPDYTDIREESLDEIDRQNNKSKNTKNADPEIVKPVVSTAETEGPKQQHVNVSTLRSDVRSKEKSPKSISEVLNTNSNLKNTGETKELAKDYKPSNYSVSEQNESTGGFESEEAGHELTNAQKRGNVAAVDEPIDFDINNYRKAFDLDDFLENDPIFKRFRLSKTKTKKKPQEIDENIPLYQVESRNEEKNYSEAGDDSSDDENVSKDTLNRSQLSNSTDASVEIFVFTDDDESVEENEGEENYASEEAKNHKVIEKVHDTDQEFLKSIFSDNKDREASPLSEKEAEFLSQYFTDEVIRELEDTHDNEDDTNQKTQSNEDIYKTLSTILDKKDQVSRLNDDINEEIQEGGKVPTRYKNLWSLEYSFPPKKVESETKVE